MSARERICAWCGEPMKGLASITIGDGPKRWYCHDDERPSCYEKAQRDQNARARWGR